ncbi:hypothetical protein AB0M54_09455 [Actinoplanes sp. NPDC051470]|uniref:hypothetical protein n=1 Tax=unclassified Actinoplanes TaxID=2626549 RepID=UPI00341F9D8E
MSGGTTAGRPGDERSRGGPPTADDPIGQIVALADDKDSDDREILRKLEALGATLDADEIFAVLVRYDTPDVLG